MVTRIYKIFLVPNFDGLQEYTLASFSITLLFYLTQTHTCTHFYQVTLEQTLPDDNLPVCSSQTLIYNCNTTTGVIRWEEGDKSITYSTAVTLNLNVPERLRQFTVQLINIDGIDLSSTATSQNTSSLDVGTTIVCQDGRTSLARSVTVAGMCMIVYLNTMNTFPT